MGTGELGNFEIWQFCNLKPLSQATVVWPAHGVSSGGLETGQPPKLQITKLEITKLPIPLCPSRPRR
jgi:hypothetical protein